jgi:hypothetical protein
MDIIDRKAAIAAYKERKSAAGIYALRCAATGQFWVGRAPDLTTIRNRVWFALRQGALPHPALQQAWNEHGEQDFSFVEMERLEDESSDYIRDAVLKDRLAFWQAKLNALSI